MKPTDMHMVGAPPLPDTDSQGPAYLPMPQVMSVYRPPMLPEADEVADLAAGRSVLAALQRAVADYCAGKEPAQIRLSQLDAANRALVDQVLGEGEVSVLFGGGIEARAQESVLTGIWLVQQRDADGRWQDYIEVADVPTLVRNRPAGTTPGAATVDILPGVINGRAVLTEILDRSARYRSGDSAYVLNLSLLPMGEADLAYLDAALGRGGVTLLSRGYGNCRITAAGPANVWWVQYFNSTDVLILNTVEIVDVPLVARAAAEDLVDSAERLAEILEELQ